MNSTCNVEEGTKLAGFDKQGILYMVQLNSHLESERILSVYKFNPITQFVDLAKKVQIFQNQPIEESTFHVCSLSVCGNYLGVYVQHSDGRRSKSQIASWFFEINLNDFEVTRNPCSFPQLDPAMCQLNHTSTRWGWILGGYPSRKGNGSDQFEFHSFQSGTGEFYNNQYFNAFLLTVATRTIPNQRLGVVDDKLYSIHLNVDHSWNFNFFNLNNSRDSSWTNLIISESEHGTYPSQIKRLFCIDKKLCALEVITDKVIRVWKVERGRPGTMAQWNLWKNIKAERGVYDFILSPKLFLNQYFAAFEMGAYDGSKILESVRVSPLDVPSLRYVSAKKSFENLSNSFNEDKMKDFFRLSAKCGMQKYTLGNKLHILSRLSESD